MLQKWNWFHLLRTLISLFACIFLCFRKDLGVLFFAELLSVYFILVGGKDFLVYVRKTRSIWILVQSFFPIFLSIWMVYSSFKGLPKDIPYYIGTWAIMLGIAYIIIGWQVCRLQIENAKHTVITGFILILFDMLVLVQPDLSESVFAYLIALFFLIDSLVSIFRYRKKSKI